MRIKGKIRSYFVCEPQQQSLIQILKIISKCLGNGLVNEDENVEINNCLLNCLSTLNFKEDHSFFYYFLKAEDLEKKGGELQEEDPENEDQIIPEQIQTELNLDYNLLFKGKY